MFTQNDIKFVIDYNKKEKFFKVLDNKRVLWNDFLNMHMQFLNKHLSTQIVYAEDLAVLKKQVRKHLLAEGVVA